MGCYSYKCKECGDAICSDSYGGDECIIFYIEKGEKKEEMYGVYNSYGAVFKDKIPEEDSESFEWNNRDEKIDKHLNNDKTTGFVAYCVNCVDNLHLKLNHSNISEDDPNQGWLRIIHEDDCGYSNNEEDEFEGFCECEYTRDFKDSKNTILEKVKPYYNDGTGINNENK